MGLFIFMRKPRGILIFVRPFKLTHGHQQNIAIIAAPCTTQVRVRKSINHRIGIMVAPTTVPTAQARIRTQLHGTKRPRWTGKCMSVPTGSNKRIHALVQRQYLRLGAQHHQ